MINKEKKLPDEQIVDKIKVDQVQEENTEGLKTEPVIEEAIDPLDERIAELEAEIGVMQHRERDTALRARAEIDNIRRRAEIDVEQAHKFALEKFASEILPVIDNLERALEASDRSSESITSLSEGIKLHLTLKSMLDAVRKFGIEVVAEVNVPFNPKLHQAMTMLESSDHEPNSVMMIMQKGYTLNGRLLRPAMIAVSKAKN